MARRSARKYTNMAVRPRQRPAASRTHVAGLLTIAVVGVFALAMLASPRTDTTVPIDSTPTQAAVAALSPTLPPPITINNGLTVVAAAPIATPQDDRPPGPYVGIVAGHWGNDSGAECPDGVTEGQVNLEIAELVTKKLREKGVWVDLLQEFDSRLKGYRADVLISIHADSCEPIDADPPASGFKVARSAASAIPNTEDKLVNCLIDEYKRATGMRFHENSITPDMTSYHSFSEIDADTPAAIIETGFLYLDYNMIVKQPDRPAQGVANGIMCFLNSQ